MLMYYKRKYQYYMQAGTTQYPEIKFKPVDFIDNEIYMKKSKYKRRIYLKQSQLFGKDLIKPQIKLFI